METAPLGVMRRGQTRRTALPAQRRREEMEQRARGTAGIECARRVRAGAALLTQIPKLEGAVAANHPMV